MLTTSCFDQKPAKGTSAQIGRHREVELVDGYVACVVDLHCRFVEP